MRRILALAFLVFGCEYNEPPPRYDSQTGKPLVSSCYSIAGTYSLHIQCRKKDDVGGGAGYVFVLRDCRALASAMFDAYQIGDIYNAVNIITEDCRQ